MADASDNSQSFSPPSDKDMSKSKSTIHLDSSRENANSSFFSQNGLNKTYVDHLNVEINDMSIHGAEYAREDDNNVVLNEISSEESSGSRSETSLKNYDLV